MTKKKAVKKAPPKPKAPGKKVTSGNTKLDGGFKKLLGNTKKRGK